MDTKAIGRILGPRFDVVSEDGARAMEILQLPADAAILDVGTGSGKFAIYLASQGYQVVTGEPRTDKSRYAGQDWASNAEKAGVLQNIRFEAFDASSLPFAAEAFDAVFFFGVLHHIGKDVRGERVVDAAVLVASVIAQRELNRLRWVHRDAAPTPQHSREARGTPTPLKPLVGENDRF